MIHGAQEPAPVMPARARRFSASASSPTVDKGTIPSFAATSSQSYCIPISREPGDQEGVNHAPPASAVTESISSIVGGQSSSPVSWAMPFTLDNWRWGLQEALTIAVLMWPCCVPSVDKMLFNGNSRWVVANATPVIEGTAGGTTRRMIDRVAGTLIAGLWVIVSISCTVGVTSEKSDRWYCLLPLYLVISLSGFIWNWLLFALPTHPLIGITAAFMTPIIVSGSVFTGSGVVYASWRSITVSFGVIVSGIISRYFLPRRARVDIINGLADIMTQLSQTLEPLVRIESGLVSDYHFLGETGAVEMTLQEWRRFKAAVWKKLELCGKMTNDQLVMVKAARTEVSLRKKNAFFEDEHLEALVNIRTLFYHVASLFFLIETQIIGSTHSDFGDQDLEGEVRHWSRFNINSRVGNLQSENANSSSNDITSTDIVKQNLRQTTSVDERVKLLITGDEEPLNVRTVAFRDLPADVPEKSSLRSDVSELVSSNQSEPHEIDSDGSATASEALRVDTTRHWLQLYGPTVGLMVRHICKALKAAAEGLRDNVFPIDAELSMKKAADAIALFHRQRAERQQATATFVEYAVHSRNSNRVAEDDPTFIARFEKMLGLKIADYEQLGENGRAAFWQSYWLFRDRLSTSDTNIMTLFVAVRTAIAAVERLIQVRRAKISRGEDLNDHLDIEKLEAQQQEAVNKAGAAVAGYRGPQWHRTLTSAIGR